MKAILAADAVERRLDPQALKDLFTLGFVAGPRTMMASVRRLPPGHRLLFERGRATLRRYWDVGFPGAVGRADPAQCRRMGGGAAREARRDACACT